MSVRSGFARTFPGGALGIIPCALVLAGCATHAVPRSKPVSSQPLAGTTLIAPTAVPPWDDVSASLKPNFALTGDQALAQVLQTTESINEQVLTALGVSLSAGLPTHSHSFTQTVTKGGTSPGTTSTDTTTNAPGTAPAIVDTLPPGVTLPAGTPYTGTLGLDPILRYKAANALFQQVQLMNQLADNVASRSCYVPYVIELKLAVINYRPRLPYAVHSHLGFFYNGYPHPDEKAAPPATDAAATAMPAPAVAGLAVAPAAVAPAAAAPPAAAPAAAAGQKTQRPSIADTASPATPKPSPELAPECQNPDLTPVVVPLLVADDVEVAVKSRAAESAAQIAGALSALVGGVGVGANAKFARTSLTAIANHDLTSTLTIGRESENTLIAVITPNNVASNDASLSNQAYDISALVLVPRYYFGGVRDTHSVIIGISNFIQYRDAKTGRVLPDRDNDFLADQADAFISRYLNIEGKTTWDDLGPDEKAAEIQYLMGPVYAADPDGFKAVVGCNDNAAPNRKLCASTGNSRLIQSGRGSLWTAVSSLVEDNVTKAALFQAQLPAPVSVRSQQVLLTDDGTHPIQAVLGGVDARSVAKVSAFLKLTPFDKTGWQSATIPVSIPSTSLTLDTAAHTLTMAFPSLKKLGISCLAPIADPKKPADTSAASCPDRAISTPAGSEERPNGIELALVGCDQTNQLCPKVTETAFTLDDWRLRRARLQRLTAMLGEPISNDTSAATNATKAADLAITAATMAIDTEEADTIALAQAKASGVSKKQIAALEATLATDTAKTKTLSITSERAVLDARFASSAADVAVLGVSLTSTGTSTAPAKFTMSDAGDIIDIAPTGTGALTIAVNGFKAPYTSMAVVTTGAGLVSVSGAASGNIAFDGKNGFLLSKNDIYTLNFTNLSTNGAVTVKLQGMTGDKTVDDPVSHTYRAMLAPQQPAKSP